MLDVACGGGRHARLLAAAGHPVTAVDRDLHAVSDLAGDPRFRLVEADLEDGSPWPLGQARFAGVVVTNYLHRPLLPRLVECVGTGGVLLYETFAQGNERFARPRNPAFLLQQGELLDAVRGALHVVAFEQGIVRAEGIEPDRDIEPDGGRARVVQRICAVRPADGEFPWATLPL